MNPSAAMLAGKGRQARWTREAIIEKIQEWHSLYGEPPRSADWNPSAAKWSGAEWRIERYRSGDWPSLNAAKKAFGGSLNDAIRAAGFEPNKSGPKRSSAAPVLSDERVVMSPDARAVLVAREAELRDLRERLATRERMLERQVAVNREVREQRDEARRAVPARPAPVERPKTLVKTKTKIERVRVEDTAVTNRLRARIERLEVLVASEMSEAKAARDRERAALRDLARTEKEAEAARDALAEAREDASVALRERKAMEDMLVAAKAVSERERVVVERVEVRSASDREVADARLAVERMEREVSRAEIRAARAEREMREQAAAITGEDRRLTQAEIRELRAGGPSGPKVLMDAMKEVVKSRAERPAALPAALTKLASAAIRWRDSIAR
jgi:hypothetical protein